ncbi:L,D-transpeptidase family protein [Anaerocolumna xylanovorans]|uniref:L,D-transpeptidase catalytic domain n=1 Tax=Anaerocolumna xylanovorans DSM 12503 TaxID=1121345 RepID=A0A1M7YF15_9FIRM|nr:L,D-transpeptidase family protein [Anaerocolumna xylanovorans]SHO51235.1 L,D-transpeptidase catalytic domain [Anaerocolumna xylanovorans DSM 12503]
MIRSKKMLQKIMLLSIAALMISFFSPVRTEAEINKPYYIKVNKQQNCVTVYGKDEKGYYTVPVKAMVCSVGVDTPLGVFQTPAKYRWKLLMGDVWGQYSTRIVKGILFHSVWYYKMDASTLSERQYNKLGTTASHGCVRLTVEDAKWIYDNCPLGTSVEIYNGKDPGPLGKPEAVKLYAGSGWDPTDPSKNNPYLQKLPTLKGAGSKSVEWGSKVDLYAGVKAVSSTGLDITKNIKASGKVDSFTAGSYKITYSVNDTLGKKTSKTVTITVKQCKSAPVIKGVADSVVGKAAVIDKAYALKGISAYLSTKKLSSKDIQVVINKVNANEYSLKYSVKAENNKIGKAAATVLVDTAPPVLEGASFKSITKEQLLAGKEGILKLAREDIAVQDDYSELTAADVKITVEPREDYAFLIHYKVSDKAGNVTKETVQYTYFDSVRIEGVQNRYDVPKDTEMDDVFALSGIHAFASDNTDCTELITVGIWTGDNKNYEITYTIAGQDGKEISVTCYYTQSSDNTGEHSQTGQNGQ